MMTTQSTSPLFPAKATSLRLAAFSSSVYNVDQGSVLYSLVDALAGDGGVGSLKKQMLIARLSRSLDTTYFSDIDSAFGNITQLVRLASETYPYSPSTDLLTSDQWDEIQVKDAWYKSRIMNFFTALGLGGTSDGLRMMVKAALSIDCDIYEMWRFQDYYAQMNGISNVSTVMNMIPTPSFENGLQGWTFIGGTSPSLTTTNAFPSGVYSGSYCLKFVTGTTIASPSVSTASTAVTAGLPYTLSAYYYWPLANSLGTFTLNAAYYNAAGSNISNTSSATITATTNTLSRAVWANFTPPATAVSAIFSLRMTGSVAGTACTVYVDAVQLTGGSSAVAYFDGSLTGYRWTGVVGNSASIKASPIDALSRLDVPSRNEIIVKPNKTSLAPEEQRQIRSMLKRLAPVNSVVTVTTAGLPKAVPVSNLMSLASSTYFTVKSFVTGNNPPTGPTPGHNQTWDWVIQGVEVEAPVSAFGEPQEYSETYPYDQDPSKTMISSVVYVSQDSRGQIFPESSYQQTDTTVSSWGPWIPFDKADSPDNYPGGKFGLTPQSAPAYNAGFNVTFNNLEPYVFLYASQQAYVASIQQDIITQSNGRWYPEAFLMTPLPNGQSTPTAYRFPLRFGTTILQKWTPEMAISTITQGNTFTVTTPAFDKSNSLQMP